MFKIPVIFENENVVVIDKPAGLVVTPGPGYEESETLVGWLIERCGEGLRGVGSGSHRPGIVHRLDKDTSGVMVAAKTQEAFLDLVGQFKERRVFKEYVVVVWGGVFENGNLKFENGRRKMRRGDASNMLGTGLGKMRMEERYATKVSKFQISNFKFPFSIHAPIGRNPRNRMKFAVTERGKPAKTRFEVQAEAFKLQEFDKAMTKLKCFPETGRTHQIRVHLKSFGHGVVGDRIYQSRGENRIFDEMVEQGVLSDRMYLHAHKLGFVVPGEGGSEYNQVFESAIPESFGWDS